jgi:NADH:ubiquinone oxidoreductase subunit 2 (subunit N)
MVALVYYLRIPAAMYDRETPAPTAVSSIGEALSSTAALVGAGFVLAFGIVPGPIFDLARTATTSLLGG